MTHLVWLGLALTAQMAAAAPPRDPSGVWRTEDGRARVRIEKCGPALDRVCGYLVWLKGEGGPPALDRRNPDPRKASRAVLGHQLILGLQANEDGQFEGLIYSAEDGKTYDVTVWLERPGDLKVKGCLVGFLCSTQSWTRTSDVQPGQLTGATGAPGGPRPDAEWAPKTGGPSPAAPPPRRDPAPRP